jgi:hypothetical protein
MCVRVRLDRRTRVQQDTVQILNVTAPLVIAQDRRCCLGRFITRLFPPSQQVVNRRQPSVGQA